MIKFSEIFFQKFFVGHCHFSQSKKFKKYVLGRIIKGITVIQSIYFDFRICLDHRIKYFLILIYYFLFLIIYSLIKLNVIHLMLVILQLIKQFMLWKIQQLKFNLIYPAPYLDPLPFPSAQLTIWLRLCLPGYPLIQFLEL